MRLQHDLQTLFRRFILLIAVFMTASTAAAQSLVLSEVEDLSEYRRIGVAIAVADLEPGMQLQVRRDGALHTSILVGPVEGLDRVPAETTFQACFSDGEPIHRRADGQAVISPQTQQVRCALTGMVPGQDYRLSADLLDQDGTAISSSNTLTLKTIAEGTRLSPPDTRPVTFALGMIFLSLIVLFTWLRWLDARKSGASNKNAYFYIAPAIFALVMLTFYPITYGIWLSFTDAHQDHLGQSSFVGLANFFEILGSSGLVQVTLFTIIWTVVNVVFHVTLGLGLAMLLNRDTLSGRGIYRTILLLPWAVPAYISVLAWQGMLQPEGLVNLILGADANYLGEVTSARISVTMVNIWLGVPFMMMSLSGALKAVPTDMYEAADIDGVSAWDQFRFITLPNLKSALVPLSLLSFIWTFNMFNTIYLLTRGGPYLGFGEPGATDIMVTFIYDVAFEYGDYGLAAAWSVAVFLLLLVFSFFYVRQTRATESVT